MKQLLITIAVVVLMGCGKTQKSDTKIENQLVKTVTKSSQSKLNTSKVLSCCNSIHEAAANGEIDAVKAYLNDGADVNERDSDGLTPLHLVEKKEIAELLIAKGAELNPIDNFFKYTPLDFMKGEVGQDTINFLRKHGAKHGTIHSAAFGGEVEAVKEFLTAGTDVNAKDDGNVETHLHRAATFCHNEIV